MSVGLPSLKHKPQRAACFNVDVDRSFEVSRTLPSGLNSVKSQLTSVHPLQSALRNLRTDELKLNNSVMFNAQGPAAPMIYAMEHRAVRQIGRHPFLPSSNFQLEVLTGQDMEIDFCDILNTEEFKESHAMPHVVMENFAPKPF